MPACAPMSASPTAWNPRPAEAGPPRRGSARGVGDRGDGGCQARPSGHHGSPAVRSPLVNCESPESPWTSSRATSTATSARPSAPSPGVSAATTTSSTLARAPRATSCGARSAARVTSGSTSRRSTAEAVAGSSSSPIVCEEIAGHGLPRCCSCSSRRRSRAEVIGRVRLAEQLRKEWLPGLASGRTKVVFAITEPEAGSNTHRLATTAARDGDGWVLRGTKHYISGVDEAAALMVVARSGRTPDGAPLLSLFVVPTNTPGLVTTPLPVDILLPDRQFVLHFDDVRVPAEAVVGEAAFATPRSSTASTPSGSPMRQPASASLAMRCGGRPNTPPPGACGTCRSGPTRASPTRSPRRRSRPSWPR